MNHYGGDAAGEQVVEDASYIPPVEYGTGGDQDHYGNPSQTNYQVGSYGYQTPAEYENDPGYDDPGQYAYSDPYNTPRGNQHNNSEDYGCQCGQNCPSGQGCRADWPIYEHEDTSGSQPPKRCKCGSGCQPGSGCWLQKDYRSCRCGRNCKAGTGCLSEAKASNYRSKHRGEEKREKAHSSHSKSDKKRPRK